MVVLEASWGDQEEVVLQAHLSLPQRLPEVHTARQNARQWGSLLNPQLKVSHYWLYPAVSSFLATLVTLNTPV